MESYFKWAKKRHQTTIDKQFTVQPTVKGVLCWESSKQPQFNNYIEWLAGSISIPYSKFQKMHQWTFQFKLWKIKIILVFRSSSFPTEQLYANFCWNLIRWDCIRLKRCVTTSRYVYISTPLIKFLCGDPKTLPMTFIYFFLELPVNLKKLSQPK